MLLLSEFFPWMMTYLSPRSLNNIDVNFRTDLKTFKFLLNFIKYGFYLVFFYLQQSSIRVRVDPDFNCSGKQIFRISYLTLEWWLIYHQDLWITLMSILELKLEINIFFLVFTIHAYSHLYNFTGLDRDPIHEQHQDWHWKRKLLSKYFVFKICCKPHSVPS